MVGGERTNRDAVKVTMLPPSAIEKEVTYVYQIGPRVVAVASVITSNCLTLILEKAG